MTRERKISNTLLTSELIAQLQQSLKENGDLPCKVEFDYEGSNQLDKLIAITTEIITDYDYNRNPETGLSELSNVTETKFLILKTESSYYNL